jgi:hypothetical protein
MKNAVHCWSTYFKRHMAFRKTDDWLVCLDKLDSFFKPALLHSKSLLSMNKCIFLFYSFNKVSTVIYLIYFHQHCFYHCIYLCSQFFLSLRAPFCFTNLDYHLIRMTSPPNYFGLARVYCSYLLTWKDSDDGVCCTELLGLFWTLFIVLYMEDKRPQRFRDWICLCPQVDGEG